jgi:Na+/proline symporter
MFVIFIGILVGCGVYAKRWVSDASDYVLAGREVSTPINMMDIIAIGFTGTTVALAPGFTIMYGFQVSAAWGLIYGICGLLVYGVLWGKFVRLNGAQTLPEFLEMRYSPAIRPIIAVTSIIGMCGILANNIVSCVSSIVGYTGWSTAVVALVIFIVILAFTFISGLWAATITDFFQVCLGVIAVPLMLYLLTQRYGGLDAIAANWLGGSFVSQGITGGTVPALALTYPFGTIGAYAGGFHSDVYAGRRQATAHRRIRLPRQHFCPSAGQLLRHRRLCGLDFHRFHGGAGRLCRCQPQHLPAVD